MGWGAGQGTGLLGEARDPDAATQMQYAHFGAAGWPMGSGSGARANKLVGAARLKGAGMHGAEQKVNVLLALRNAVCNDRWGEVWGRSKPSSGGTCACGGRSGAGSAGHQRLLGGRVEPRGGA